MSKQCGSRGPCAASAAGADCLQSHLVVKHRDSPTHSGLCSTADPLQHFRSMGEQYPASRVVHCRLMLGAGSCTGPTEGAPHFSFPQFGSPGCPIAAKSSRSVIAQRDSNLGIQLPTMQPKQPNTPHFKH